MNTSGPRESSAATERAKEKTRGSLREIMEEQGERLNMDHCRFGRGQTATVATIHAKCMYVCSSRALTEDAICGLHHVVT
ncbi:hypothetical protein VTI28DRAFT_2731 [Corynascus sepedonium]